MKVKFNRFGGMSIIRNGVEYEAYCGIAPNRLCGLCCPHLDDSEPGVIRLTCGGTDVVLERADGEDE